MLLYTCLPLHPLPPRLMVVCDVSDRCLVGRTSAWRTSTPRKTPRWVGQAGTHDSGIHHVIVGMAMHHSHREEVEKDVTGCLSL